MLLLTPRAIWTKVRYVFESKRDQRGIKGGYETGKLRQTGYERRTTMVQYARIKEGPKVENEGYETGKL